MKKERKSIFPEKLPILGEFNDDIILNEIEILSGKIKPGGYKRVFTSENSGYQREIADLVRMGYSLPDADSPGVMLLENGRQKNVPKRSAEKDPYKMINLISGSFTLPEIEDDNWLK